MSSMYTTDHSRRIFIAVFCLVLLSSCSNKIVAESDRIRIFEPAQNETVSSPFTLRGEARTFENNVRFRLKDSQGTVLVDSFTTAAGEMGRFGSFEAEIVFNVPSAKEGVIEIFEESAEDGSEIGKIVIPVRF